MSRGNVGGMAHVKGRDAVTVIRCILAVCPDERLPVSSTELSFVRDDELRDNIRRDMSATTRALNNAEWKAATVLAGATIEALLHWRLQEPPPDDVAIQRAIDTLVAAGKLRKPPTDRDVWGLNEFIKVSAHLGLIKPDTATAAILAQNFRNLIIPAVRPIFANLRPSHSILGSRSIRACRPRPIVKRKAIECQQPTIL